ncbi:alpha/beta hydrolase [Alcanivorax quisquiliarum]|uniref:Alpha/beta hydrolase n=1 Tax=Alcanivorax quisquiliarum TaxID=2933565 RepID=A0ABT0E7U3_9GAMM|nr:alpha/beta fold hydrolase [Alcanivorax quisquiliarum]MCK0537910.1 alpha/beta hydrolase [Alcanivorax quisquiliarum]
MSRPSQEKITLSGPAGALEAVLELTADTPAFIAIVCHPHPLFGGTMQNKVVTTLSRACRDAGAAVLRFNFRGVGASQGAFSEGQGETEDLLAAESWLRQRYPGLPLWLAGFSFGSFVAARGAGVLAANERAPAHLFLVAPPVHNFDFTSVDSPGCPVTVVQSEDDEVVPAEKVFAWQQSTPLAPDLIRFSGAGHFFHGKLVQLAEVVRSRLPE